MKSGLLLHICNRHDLKLQMIAGCPVWNPGESMAQTVLPLVGAYITIEGFLLEFNLHRAINKCFPLSVIPLSHAAPPIVLPSRNKLTLPSTSRTAFLLWYCPPPLLPRLHFVTLRVLLVTQFPSRHLLLFHDCHSVPRSVGPGGSFVWTLGDSFRWFCVMNFPGVLSPRLPLRSPSSQLVCRGHQLPSPLHALSQARSLSCRLCCNACILELNIFFKLSSVGFGLLVDSARSPR